jgi:hypothetical protein
MVIYSVRNSSPWLGKQEEIVCGVLDFYSVDGSLANPPADNIFGAFEGMIAPALLRHFTVLVVFDSQIHTAGSPIGSKTDLSR